MARLAGGGQIERLSEGDETYSETLKFLERCHQIGDGPAPSIQSSYHCNIDFTAARGSE